MAHATKSSDPAILAHQQWLGYLQPVGLVVSPPALVQAQAFVDANIGEKHARFLEHVSDARVGDDENGGAIDDLVALFTDPALFDWKHSDFVDSSDPRAAELHCHLLDYQETLKPTYAIPEPNGGWLLLIQELPFAVDFDETIGDARRWQVSPQVKFERLLRETGVPIGLLSNGVALRLVYFPRQESPGHVTFPVAAMRETAGRPVLAALLMLLGADRLFTLPDKQRLPSLLAESRKYQNTVSTELAEQVLAALFELLRGFQAADDRRKGELLRDVLDQEPDQVYAGLVTVLMRLVFTLYAEDRGLMSDHEVYTRYYSVVGLWERLREDDGRHRDTMDQRYGAWAQLVALFRAIHDGGKHGSFRLPKREGYLFDPDRYPFLEGRPWGHRRVHGERLSPPLVSDGVVYRVLNNLLVLSGERISYRTLDVEQIGSVYEAIMGYRLERASGRAIALKPKKAHGAPVTINLDALLKEKSGDRAKWLEKNADQKIDGKPLAALKAAESVEALVAALEKRTARTLTPHIVSPGSMVLQPSDERRRSGSHYTPRALTKPIVEKALEPVLQRLGESPTPEQILSLKVCDPAMGSGAFLVEACRQLGEALVRAWTQHGSLPRIPDDETPELFAQRTVSQRCLYGVDKNPMAVDLAKLSLWLATLAKDHPFTFVDHALKHGDSLVGLTLNQIRRFHWKANPLTQLLIGADELSRRVNEALVHRRAILAAGDEGSDDLKRQKLNLANEGLQKVRLAGDLAIGAFFAANSEKEREAERVRRFAALGEYLRTNNFALRPKTDEATLREGPHPLRPFHWEIEFPEVFLRESEGFDTIIGNPPFMGGRNVTTNLGGLYAEWILAVTQGAGGGADLVAHFFRRAFLLIRDGGTLGLLATNSVSQGDTRSAGLRWILSHGGEIYSANKRYKWPGAVAVVVSVVHITKGKVTVPKQLNGKPVEKITAYLFHEGSSDDPKTLSTNSGRSFQGSILLGMGFTFDDSDNSGVSHPLSEMHRLIAARPKNAERIFPYIGGEEVNESPCHANSRYVVDFGEMTELEARNWPDLFALLERSVKVERAGKDAKKYPRMVFEWWKFWNSRPELSAAKRGLDRMIVVSRVRATGFTFIPTTMVVSEQLIAFPMNSFSAFAALQSREHEVWAHFFSGTALDLVRYSPSDCFETFPFPVDFETQPVLEAVGREYYEFRAALMIRNNEGLTKTYNRFHDPAETSPDILKLRELHAAMDRAVLDAYGGPLAALVVPPCEFLLDYEEEDDDEESGGRKKKKPWRYRWPDSFRDEVLALLLELNKQRAEEERLAGPAAAPKKAARKKSTKKAGGELFET